MKPRTSLRSVEAHTSAHPHSNSRLSPAIIYIVGGDLRPEALQRLRLALPGLHFEWIPTCETDPSSRAFIKKLAREGVALVVLLVGLCRHAHSAAVRQICRRLRQPLLWLHRSPNPESIRRELNNRRGGQR